MDVGPTWPSPFFLLVILSQGKKATRSSCGSPSKGIEQGPVYTPRGGFPEAKVRAVLVSCGLGSRGVWKPT